MRSPELIWEYRAKGASSIQGGPTVVGERVFVVTHPTAEVGKPSLLAFELRAGRKKLVWEVENVWGELELRAEVLVTKGRGVSLEGVEVEVPEVVGAKQVSSRRTSEERFASEEAMVKAGVHSVVTFNGEEVALPARLNDWGIEGEWLVVRSGDEVLGVSPSGRWRADARVGFVRGKWPVRTVEVGEGAVVFHRGKRELVCLELESGETRWEVEAPGQYEARPVFGAGVVYSFGEQRGGSVHAFDLETGALAAKFGKGRIERVSVAGEIVACRTHSVARVFGPPDVLLAAKSKTQAKTKSKTKKTGTKKGGTRHKPTLEEQLEQLGGGAKEVRAAKMDLGDAGAQRIGSLGGGEIEALDLRSNGITAAGVRALCDAAALRGLRTLNLSGNPIGDEGAVLLAKAFPRLDSLELQRCGIGDEGCSALAQAVWRLEHLLLIDHNPFGIEGVRSLASAESLSEYQREQFHLILEDEGEV